MATIANITQTAKKTQNPTVDITRTRVRILRSCSEPTATCRPSLNGVSCVSIVVARRPTALTEIDQLTSGHVGPPISWND